MRRSTPPTAGTHFSEPIRASVLLKIFETASEFGCDLTEKFAALGLTPGSIESSETFISLGTLAEALSIAMQKTGRSDFPLLLASRQNLAGSTNILLLLRTAPTLRDCFRDIVKYSHNFSQAVHFTFDESAYAESLLFSINCHNLTPDQHRICAELFLAQNYQNISAILGSPPRLERVYFAFSQADKGISFSRYFRADVEYESERFGFEFTKGALEKPLVYANTDVHDSLVKYLSASETQMVESLDQTLRAVIHSLLPTQTLSIDRVARSLSCSRRTLQRWIKDECGVSYKALVEEVRFDLAKQLLEQSHMSLTDISLAVGYANPSNFTRGFKKVFGCSPREWRKHRNIKEKRRVLRPFLS